MRKATPRNGNPLRDQPFPIVAWQLISGPANSLKIDPDTKTLAT